MELKFTLNGKKVATIIDADSLLIDVVRDLGCASVKRGCDTSNCGLCTVLMDGTPVLSCSTLAARADGHEIYTLEGLEKEAEDFIYSFLKPIYTILLIILFRPKIIGKENIPKEGSIIFAGNHKHAVDPTMVMMSTNRIVHFMAKEELFKGIHGIIFKCMGLIKVYRGKANPQAVIEAENVLNNGGTVGIFPEGTSNRTKQGLLRFRHGAVAIAKKTNTTPENIKKIKQAIAKDLEVSENIGKHPFHLPWFKHFEKEWIEKYAAAVRKVIENHKDLLASDAEGAQGGSWYGMENE